MVKMPGKLVVLMFLLFHRQIDCACRSFNCVRFFSESAVSSGLNLKSLTNHSFQYAKHDKGMNVYILTATLIHITM
jgi:hypothetical protein